MDRKLSREFLQGYRYAQSSPTLLKNLFTDTDIDDIITVLENQPHPYSEIARGMAAYYRAYAARLAEEEE